MEMGADPKTSPKGGPLTAQARTTLATLGALTLLTGIVYPVAMTLAAQAWVPQRASGGLIVVDGTAVGAELVGQNFTDPKYFWGRPSATSPRPYDPMSSGGSNLGPTNPALVEQAKGRAAALRDADPGNAAPIPIDLVASSASGLDPDISVAAARYQAPRVARARGIPADRVNSMIDQLAQARDLGFLGEPRVSVLRLNLSLDQAGHGR